MSLTRIDTPHAAAADDAAYAAVNESPWPRSTPIVIVSDFDEAVRLKKKWAGGVAFGCTVVTFKAWVQDLWELYGDGRTFVDPIERRFLVQKALSRHCAMHTDCLLNATPGTRAFITSIVREALPLVTGAPGGGAGECEAVEVIGSYRSLLEEHGLVEYAEALERLEGDEAYRGCRLIVVGVEIDDLTALERRFLEAADATVITNGYAAMPPESGRATELEALGETLYHPDEENPITPSGAVRFVLPSGRYAAPRALCDTVESLLADDACAEILVVSREPHSTFAALAPRLSERGIAAEARGTVPFAATEFGSAWLALLEVLFGSSARIGRAATDFALSAYSGVGVRNAYWMDVRWRANRALDRDAILTDLCGNADHGINGLVGSLENGRTDDAFDIMQAHIVKQTAWPAGYRDRQLAALSLARSVCATADRLGADKEDYRSILAEQRLFLSVSTDMGASVAPPAEKDAITAARNRSPVRILDLDAVAALASASCDALIVTELTAREYAVGDGVDAASAFLEMFGTPRKRDELTVLRTRFSAAIAVPRRALILSRPLNTVTADEERPAVILEDVIDCYRSDLQNPGEVDGSTGLPESLRPFTLLLGEQDVYENLSVHAAPQPMVAEIPIMPTGFVTSEARGKIILPQQHGGVIAEGYSLSPSAIESYLECPYKWFAHRRLRLEELDAGFGGREFGLFAHRVLELFYARFRADVAPKVTLETLPEARVMLEHVFDAQLAYEATLIGDPVALVPLTDLERKEVADLKRKLIDYLDREALLLPGYAPLDGEVSFGRGQQTFDYAGFKVNGTIDRVDTDGFGRAVVIDYKGAVGKAYALREHPGDFDGAAPAFELPRKVQTLIYAQAVRKTRGLEPVAALYLSYGKDRGIAGSFDHRALDPEKDLLGIDVQRCGVDDFTDLLDRVEEAVAERLAHLLAGEVPACPRDVEACTYCPVTVCSVRDAVQRQRGEV